MLGEASYKKQKVDEGAEMGAIIRNGSDQTRNKCGLDVPMQWEEEEEEESEGIEEYEQLQVEEVRDMEIDYPEENGEAAGSEYGLSVLRIGRRPQTATTVAGAAYSSSLAGP